MEIRNTRDSKIVYAIEKFMDTEQNYGGQRWLPLYNINNNYNVLGRDDRYHIEETIHNVYKRREDAKKIKTALEGNSNIEQFPTKYRIVSYEYKREEYITEGEIKITNTFKKIKEEK